MKCAQTITFEEVESDIKPTVYNAEGPWHYKDITKVFVHYKILINDTLYSNKIMLHNLRNRGFPKGPTSFVYTWYSWLRFKAMAPKEGPLPDVLAKENLFLSVLQMVNGYYQ